jgi:drug/metabolite transporter (DMT)-like permease
MDAIVLAFVSAALFGAMPVAVRFAFTRHLPAAVGTLLMQAVTLGILAAAAVIQGGITLHGILPFLLAGVVAPGMSQLFIIVAIREAGSSRASVAFGTAPLFAVVLAIAAFGEDPDPALLSGACLIVGGGLALAGEKRRPVHLRRIGIAYALVGAILFAFRDNLVRHLSLDTEVPSMTAGAATLMSGIVVTALFVVLRRQSIRCSPIEAARWCLPGALVGLSYVALFEAFYRGTVSVVAPIVGTESLWGVGFSALFLHRTEQVGARLVAGAVLVVAGSVLIGIFR